jgi:hypothetical protein
MRGHHLRHTIEFIEAASGEKFHEPRAVVAAQDEIAFLVGPKSGPAIFHEARPENLRAFEDHAIGPDLDAAIEFDGLGDNEPILDRQAEKLANVLK